MIRWLGWLLAATTEILETAFLGLAVVAEMVAISVFGGDGDGGRAATTQSNPAEQSLGRVRSAPPDSCDNLPPAVQAELAEVIIRASSAGCSWREHPARELED